MACIVGIADALRFSLLVGELTAFYVLMRKGGTEIRVIFVASGGGNHPNFLKYIKRDVSISTP